MLQDGLNTAKLINPKKVIALQHLNCYSAVVSSTLLLRCGFCPGLGPGVFFSGSWNCITGKHTL